MMTLVTLFVIILTLTGFSCFWLESTTIYIEYMIYNINNINYRFYLLIDTIRLIFFLTVLLIRIRVMIFSSEYILGEKTYMGFHILVLVFIIRIVFLIFSPNILSGMLGWDGLGLSSYLLVIYYSREKSFNSGMITALTNRLGDALLLFTIGFFLTYYRWRIKLIRQFSLRVSLIPFILLIIGCSTKRAQLPFCAWLPAAIAAPTPVSSLVHSSTLVTAGVYLFLRHEQIFKDLLIRDYLLFLGLATIILSSLSALYEYDIKKIVALSTLSQLGVMVVSIGLGLRAVAFFHLLAHAYFKALLFICTGRIIHRRNNYQDIRVMGTSPQVKPIVLSFIIVSMLRLSGLPFMSAFFSKEMILEGLISLNYSLIEMLIFFFGAILTLLYRARFLWFVYWTYNKKSNISFLEDIRLPNFSRIMILVFPALFGGWLIKKYMFASFMLFTRSTSFKLCLLSSLLLCLFTLPVLIQKGFGINWGWYKFRLARIWIMPFFRAQLITQNIPLHSLSLTRGIDRGVVTLFTRKLFSVSYWDTDYLKISIFTQSKLLIVLACWFSVIIFLNY